MDAHIVGFAPRLAAPELAHHDVVDLAPLGTAAAHAVVTPTSDNAHLAVGAVERQGAADTPDCAQGDAERKRFATLRAMLALKGYSLSRTHGDDGPACFHVNRWGMVRELRDIAAVRAFAVAVGARP